jgi:hypothetical protein
MNECKANLVTNHKPPATMSEINVAASLYPKPEKFNEV